MSAAGEVNIGTVVSWRGEDFVVQRAVVLRATAFAWRLLEQAGDLMRRSARLLADGGGPERLELELERTRQLIDTTRDRLGADATESQRKLLAEAEEALQRAMSASDQGQPGRQSQLAWQRQANQH